MIKYIKDSIRELKHVVWPTREETKNYFVTVTVVLVLFGVYLFIASTVFTNGLFGLKDFIKGTTSVEKSIDWSYKQAIDIKKISAEVKPTVKVDSIKVENKTEELVKEATATWATK